MRRRQATVLLIAAAPLLWAAGIRGQPNGQLEPVEPAEKPTTEVPREACATAECHGDVKAYEHLHGPLNVNACDACHALTSAEEHAFEPVRPRDELCQFCHTDDIAEANYVHAPLITGDCLECHDPHGSVEPTMLRGATYSAMCRNCHDAMDTGFTSVHGPVAAGACGACHEAHVSRHPNMLDVQGRELCVQCHISTDAQIKSMHYAHSPAEVDCRVCHDAHASSHSVLLNEEPEALCESCHQNIRLLVETATTQHAAVTTEQSCLNCHTAHASDVPRMLKSNPIQLCFDCHDQELEREDGTTVRNMKALIESGRSLHGPTAEDNCVACHEIHGGGHERLLTQEFPSELYYPFSEDAYSLCFSCHDRNIVLEPVTDAVTNFRNGDTNLHYVHVNREDKGRSCRLCHDTHAGDREKHIHNEIEYGPGGWNLPIGFEPTDTGGSCEAGCHQSYRYDRRDPVAYREPEERPDFKDEFIEQQRQRLDADRDADGNADGTAQEDGP